VVIREIVKREVPVTTGILMNPFSETQTSIHDGEQVQWQLHQKLKDMRGSYYGSDKIVSLGCDYAFRL
jgi:hypothetical protein